MTPKVAFQACLSTAAADEWFYCNRMSLAPS